ncbi:hypothetical protein OIU77_026707 [Salix suchowensis]|uniref:Uncharacterized protein n=1 Tax=Salix suchowensis TaxID=1278906 RepID=A0ABQ9BPT2_9ROSI|nr:hypothetical protein OIU77_026707 [Salix suchowensis]
MNSRQKKIVMRIKGSLFQCRLQATPNTNFFRCSPSDPEAMAADHHKFSLQGGTGQLLNTALGISEDTLLLTVVISGNTAGDQDQGRYTMSDGTERQLTMEFQEAKNAKEVVFLHLAGASLISLLWTSKCLSWLEFRNSMQLKVDPFRFSLDA